MLLRVASEVFNVSDTQHSQQGLEQGLELGLGLAVRRLGLWRAARASRNQSQRLQLIKRRQHGLPTSGVLLGIDRCGEVPIKVQDVLAQLR